MSILVTVSVNLADSVTLRDLRQFVEAAERNGADPDLDLREYDDNDDLVGLSAVGEVEADGEGVDEEGDVDEERDEEGVDEKPPARRSFLSAELRPCGASRGRTAPAAASGAHDAGPLAGRKTTCRQDTSESWPSAPLLPGRAFRRLMRRAPARLAAPNRTARTTRNPQFPLSPHPPCPMCPRGYWPGRP
jgi:hypothetical protein